MTGKSIRFALLACALVLASCGAIATPVWEAAETEEAEGVAVLPTEIDLEPTQAETVEVEPTVTPVPPTETPAPTATPVPPTETPAPTATTVPPTPTTEPAVETEEAAEPEAVAAAVEGDPANGEVLFNSGAGAAIPCVTCHYVNSSDPLVGPGMAGIATRADDRVPEQDAVEYLHESIVAPDAYVVEGFPPGVMPQNYDETLSEDQINDLVAFLMTLE